MPPDLKSSNKNNYNNDYNYTTEKRRIIYFPTFKMNKLRKIRSKISIINYYILLSILIHFCLFLFTGLQKDIALGDKIIPIEIIDIISEPSQGEYFKRQEEKSVNKTQKKLH